MKDCSTDWISFQGELQQAVAGRIRSMDPLDGWRIRTPDPMDEGWSRWYCDKHCVDVGGVTVVDILSGKAHWFGPIIISGHSPEYLRFGPSLQFPVGTSTLGGRPGDFDKSFVEGQVVPVKNQKNLIKTTYI